MYPVMQRIVNLYEFEGLEMRAMKRSFDIEDENNIRYMPTTREMSQMWHRKIRQWLYDPVYDSTLLPANSPNFSTDFRKRKEELTERLKVAFSIELFTIPIYLTAYFTTIDQESKKLIREIALEEMKHLFIVSNCLNALGSVDGNA